MKMLKIARLKREGSEIVTKIYFVTIQQKKHGFLKDKIMGDKMMKNCFVVHHFVFLKWALNSYDFLCQFFSSCKRVRARPASFDCGKRLINFSRLSRAFCVFPSAICA